MNLAEVIELKKAVEHPEVLDLVALLLVEDSAGTMEHQEVGDLVEVEDLLEMEGLLIVEYLV